MEEANRDVKVKVNGGRRGIDWGMGRGLCTAGRGEAIE
jgi:hypothetical protein